MHRKHKMLIRMLTSGQKVLVLLDPRIDGVEVPEDCYHTLPLGLMLGSDLAIPIPDLSLNSDGFTATLSFNRVGHKISIPWKSIFGMVNEDNEGPLWPEDIPPEVSGNFPLDMESNDDEDWEDEDDVEPDKPSFGILDGGGESQSDPDNDQRPVLRLITANGEDDDDTTSDEPT